MSAPAIGLWSNTVHSGVRMTPGNERVCRELLARSVFVIFVSPQLISGMRVGCRTRVASTRDRGKEKNNELSFRSVHCSMRFALNPSLDPRHSFLLSTLVPRKPVVGSLYLTRGHVFRHFSTISRILAATDKYKSKDLTLRTTRLKKHPSNEMQQSCLLDLGPIGEMGIAP